MIKKIEIKGFKAFDYAELELNNFTLLAGKNSMGKTSVIQAIFAMLQNEKNPFRGEYMNIGKVNELQNIITGSREIKLGMEYEQGGKSGNVTKKINKTQTLVEPQNAIEIFQKMQVIYCSSERIGVKDTYEKYLGDEIVIGKNCDFVFHYLNAHAEDEMQVKDGFVYDPKSKVNKKLPAWSGSFLLVTSNAITEG